MSLTTDVTPFESPVEVAPVPPIETAHDLSTEDEDVILAAGREQRVRDSLSIQRTAPVRRATLRVAHTDTLVRIAQSNGFRLEPSRRKGRQVLTSATGDRIVLRREGRGSVRVHSSGKATLIEQLAREHNRERAVGYLRGLGLAVREARLPNGEIQILGEGESEGKPAQVAVQVRANGTYVADVDRTQGTACAPMVHGLVEATGGKVVATDLKPTYHARPEKDVKTKVRI